MATGNCADSTPMLDLWVRAGVDGLRSGGCRLGQQMFMVLLLKADDPQAALHFNVKTVNLLRPNDEFKSLGLRHVPAIVHGEVKSISSLSNIWIGITHMKFDSFSGLLV